MTINYSHGLVGLFAAAAIAGAIIPSKSARSQSRADDNSPSDTEILVQHNNHFAFDLYNQVAKSNDGNIAFSPFSISSALAMTYAGARGETATQMANTLHFSLPNDRLHSGFGRLVGNMKKDAHSRRSQQLHIANTLWGQEGFPFKSDFIELNNNNYDSGLKSVDFQRDPDQARQAINRWVEDKTQKRIHELLRREDVNNATRLVLTNAICFKANWEQPFEKDQTKLAEFNIRRDNRPLIPTMYIPKGQFPYFNGRDFSIIELPYDDKHFSMLVIVPQPDRTLADIEKTMSGDAFKKSVAKMQVRTGSVSLPRFKISFAIRLKDQLSTMGMSLAFSARADFSGISPNVGFWIDDVIHKASIDVDEVGAEAAAATAVKLIASASTPFEFSANRPFIYVIRDSSAGTILFAGRVVDPRQ